MITSRTHPKLLDIYCQITENQLSFNYNNQTFNIPHPNSKDHITLNIFGYETYGTLVSKKLYEWFSDYLDLPCRLMKVSLKKNGPVLPKHGGKVGDQVGFGDQAPILILSEASIDDLNKRLDDPIGMERFRPNVIISGVEAYDEDHWSCIQIGTVTLCV